MEEITVSPCRMRLQEIALLDLVLRGYAQKKVLKTGKTIYKIDCENPWQPSNGKKIIGLK